ncbi:hypothetical protein PGT21_002319 [Puccinia graminis f. sp. tritici]|uniref:Uncharacterized protein n=1 Tax=Puccinia graminis f. sp. tritici TaxID=56615 RepID=A0A5B0ND68_PUCGR|nr:hypothetical protein PGTUg99_020671 [Puccinia graminis f. sp. tritici]KAA1088965.1 hypothetical protein PGT21_002319 [Puccinia graminis f. sp. tritici]
MAMICTLFCKKYFEKRLVSLQVICPVSQIWLNQLSQTKKNLADNCAGQYSAHKPSSHPCEPWIELIHSTESDKKNEDHQNFNPDCNFQLLDQYHSCRSGTS